jgi:putative membrane protein
MQVAVLSLILIWSGYQPFDRQIWCFEVFPAIVLMISLAWSSLHRSLTLLSQWLLACAVILILVGSHYTYARMPIFSFFQEIFSFERNHYDRFGHFFQGAVPAIVIRELLLRHQSIKGRRLLHAIIVAICLALSALWELVEWFAVVALGGSPDVYLSFQGDPWDTQADMAFALLGAATILLLFGKLHDKQFSALFEQDGSHPSRKRLDGSEHGKMSRHAEGKSMNSNY